MATNIEISMSADQERMFQEWRKTVEMQSRIEQGFRGIKGAAGGAGRAGKRAFGRSGVAALKGYVTGLVSVQAGIQVAIRLYDKLDEASRRASSRIKESEQDLAQLTQLAGGDPVKLQKLVLEAKELYRAGGAESLGAAGRAVFSLESAGALDQRKLFGNLFGIVADIDTLARATTTLKTGFGVEETGDIKGIIAKGSAASKSAPASIEEILEAATKGAEFAKQLGLGDEAVLAATTVTAKAIKSADEGGTATASLLASLAQRPGFAGKTLPEMIDKITAMQLGPEELKTFLGRKESIRAYGILRDQSKMFADVFGDIQAARPEDVDALIRSRDQQTQLRAALIGRQAKAGRELAEETKGVAYTLAEAGIDKYVQSAEEQGQARLFTEMGEWGLRFKLSLIGPDAMARYLDDVTQQQIESFSRSAEGSGLLTAPQRGQVQQELDPDASPARELAEAGVAIKEAAHDMREANEKRDPLMGPEPNTDV